MTKRHKKTLKKTKNFCHTKKLFLKEKTRGGKREREKTKTHTPKPKTAACCFAVFLRRSRPRERERFFEMTPCVEI